MTKVERTEWAEFKTEIRDEISDIHGSQLNIVATMGRIEGVLSNLATETFVNDKVDEKIKTHNDSCNEFHDKIDAVKNSRKSKAPAAKEIMSQDMKNFLKMLGIVLGSAGGGVGLKEAIAMFFGG